MMNKIRMLLPIGFFAIILFGLVSHVSITDSKVSDMENRTLEKAPLEPTVNELLSGGWSAQVETYFSDQFPARETWLRTFVKVELAMGKAYLDDKYHADTKTGWITSKPAGLQPSETLKASTDEVAVFKSELDTIGVPFTFFSLPAKATYVREPHPAYMPDDSGIDNNRAFLTLLTEKDVDNVLLMDTMRKLNGGHMDTENWYFQTDHHWNINGAFAGYQAIVTELSERIGETLTPMSTDNTEKTCLDNEFAGSWNKVLYLLISNDDKICYQEPEVFDDQFTVYKGPVLATNEVQRSEIYALGRDLPTDQSVSYSVGYSSDFGELNILNDTYESDGHLLIIKDSYFNSIQFQVASHFKKTTIIDLRYFEGDISTFLKTLQPSYAIMAYNDRNFDLGM